MKHRKRSSEKANEANRENAQKSTGPRSETGKLRSSYNAVKHGLLSKTLKLNDDEKVEFRKFVSSLVEEFRPRGVAESMVVEDIVTSWWKMKIAQGLLLKELGSRKTVSQGVLEVLANTAAGYSSQADLSDISGSNWGVQELVFKVDTKKFENEDANNSFPRKTAAVACEAKLANTSETLSRYERLWRSDFYRALKTFEELQQREKRPHRKH